MKIDVFDINGNLTQPIEAGDILLIHKKATQSVFDQVMAEYATDRQGTHSTLTKAEVRGGGKKPRPQKHSGRSR
ncbi:MAG: 50S ribosomal protein L4, partial [Mycoplasmataceae bacterium]|nr:50S ribosomal protein L4 [Mycoplasmataceae bacterium]